ncbi:MAG TPA: protein kinase [Pyrinomonadaceae bacterium]|nr:protein kinase [Pyrinomonadaceae bacterium]
MPERRRRIEELFHAALDCRGDAERDALLAEACAGDAPLREEIERLLAADKRSETFMEEPAARVVAERFAASSAAPHDSSETSAQRSPHAHEAAFSPGEVLAGRYEIERPLGRGGIGVVYLARDRQLLGKRVVVKRLLDESLRSEWMVRKFKHEMEALTRLDHRGIVGVRDAGETGDGLPYIVMQYIEGVDLAHALEPAGMSLERVARLMRQAGRALSAAHEAGVLHRDLKPANIMLQPTSEGDEEVKLIDFGIAKVKNSVLAPSTAVAQAVGTVSYMSPEQLNAEELTPASDVYSLGVIAYEMLTGRKPFVPASVFQLPEMQRAGVRVLPRALRPDLPEAAESVMLKALSFRPHERYASARQFGESLALALEAGAEIADAAKGARDEGARLSGEGAQRRGDGFVEDEAIAARTASKSRSRKRALRLLLGVAAASSALVVIGALLMRGVRERPVNVASSPPAVSNAAQLTFTYWLDVQKYRGGRPFEEEFRLAGEINFEKDYRVRLGIVAPQPGYLYIVNEGPETAGGLPDYNVLFPTPTANDGSAFLKANQTIRIPERVPFKFDAQKGVEKLWLIYSAQSIAELEAVKGVVNAVERGVVSDRAQILTLRDFIARRAASMPEVARDEGRTLTSVTSREEILVHLLRLEHH